MKPGPELDALIAEHVMGTINNKDKKFYHYSTSIAHAWEVVEEIGNDPDLDFYNLEIVRFGPVRWQCRNHTDEGLGCENEINATAKTAPHAICLAALKVVGHES